MVIGNPIRSGVAACALACVTLLVPGCTYYQAPPAPYAISPPPPSTFDRAWDAALGAASDEGVEVTSQDRANGVITGIKGKARVEIGVRTQADGSVRVSFNAKGPTGRETALADRLSNAYDRRMGR